MKKKVLVVGEGIGYYRPFRRFGGASRDQELFKRPEMISLVVFTGGADISPSLYGHKPSQKTSCYPKRDIYEMLAFRKARKHNLPIVGICRGAQLLCTMSGGTLYQHVSGHECGNHIIRTWDDRLIKVTSTHHQMQNPPQDAKVLAWADPQRSNVYIGDADKKLPIPQREYECVHYPAINALGLQYHPEMMSDFSDGFKLTDELVNRFLIR